MGNFRSNDRGGRRDNFRGSFGGFNRGFGGDRGRRPLEMHDAVCDKCKKECQVPFRPTPGKPVLCSECFKQGGSSSPRQDRSSAPQSGVSSDQFKQLNIKLDKILEILESLEIIEEDESEEEEGESEGEEGDDKCSCKECGDNECVCEVDDEEDEDDIENEEEDEDEESEVEEEVDESVVKE